MTAELPPEHEAGLAAEVDHYLRDVASARRRLAATEPGGTVTHIAGADVQVGSRLRQRCSWCGAVLADYDLERIAVPEGQDPRPSMWPRGELVRKDGNAWFIVEHESGADLPADACAATETCGDPGNA